MKTKTILILEGMPGAGKSSIIDYYKNYKNIKIAVFPQILPKNNVNNLDEYFLEQELKRTKEIEEKAERIFFIDRGIFSHLAYAHAISVLLPNESKKFLKLSALYEKKYKKLMYKHHYILFLDVEDRVGIFRRNNYKDFQIHKLWFDKYFIQQLRRSYQYVFEKYQTYPIVINTTYLTKENMLKEFDKFMRNEEIYVS